MKGGGVQSCGEPTIFLPCRRFAMPVAEPNSQSRGAKLSINRYYENIFITRLITVLWSASSLRLLAGDRWAMSYASRNIKMIYKLEQRKYNFVTMSTFGCLTVLKLNFKFQKSVNSKQYFATLNSIISKTSQLQTCRWRREQQFWYKVCLHPNSYRKVMNYFLMHLFIVWKSIFGWMLIMATFVNSDFQRRVS